MARFLLESRSTKHSGRAGERRLRCALLHGVAMLKLVLLRHGESTWNQENRFTGWTDVDLSRHGRRRRRTRPAALLRDEGYDFDVAYTSRAASAPSAPCGSRSTSMDLMWLPVAQALAPQRAPLRRAAGPQQGRDGREVRRGAGATVWRRSYDVPPPAARRRTIRAHPSRDPRYAGARRRPSCRSTESLEGHASRAFLPCWHETIAPADARGPAACSIAAHGNSLRALVKHLDGISDADIVELNIPTGIPLVYELDDRLNVVTPLLPCRPRPRRQAARAVAGQACAPANSTTAGAFMTAEPAAAIDAGPHPRIAGRVRPAVCVNDAGAVTCASRHCGRGPNPLRPHRNRNSRTPTERPRRTRWHRAQPCPPRLYPRTPTTARATRWARRQSSARSSTTCSTSRASFRRSPAAHDYYLALAYTVRDQLLRRWVEHRRIPTPRNARARSRTCRPSS
ncbi:MAG: 2,3-bisphosphoglycerate-dependent phosphoglycerate mutase [Chromatiales bacterium]|nr:2,3-bisphosphoglycerate-dependent phosphoglycerate mutase [Chromatiales bacterium]